MAHLDLSIDSNIDDVPFLAVAINMVATYAGFNEIQASEIELCVVEAVTNVITHAYTRESGHPVTVAIESAPDRLSLRICDKGTPMYRDNLDRLLRGESIAEPDVMAEPDPADRALLAEHGRGLSIIHDLMDEITYTRDGDLNCLLLVRYFSPA